MKCYNVLMYRYYRKRRSRTSERRSESPLEELLTGLGALYLLSLLFLYITNRPLFWQVFVAGLVLLVLAVWAIKRITDYRAGYRQRSFEGVLQRMREVGFESELKNFIVRFGHETKYGDFEYRGYAFTNARLRDLGDLARKRGLALDGTALYKALHHYIEERERSITFESVGAGEQRRFKDLSGPQFEQLLVRLFEAMGYAVQWTGRTGDQGGDLIANKGDRRILIQAKCWNGSVGNEAVQQAAAAKQYWDCKEAGVVATSNFTPEARELAKATGVKLTDKEELQALLLEHLKESWS